MKNWILATSLILNVLLIIAAINPLSVYSLIEVTASILVLTFVIASVGLIFTTIYLIKQALVKEEKEDLDVRDT